MLILVLSLLNSLAYAQQPLQADKDLTVKINEIKEKQAKKDFASTVPALFKIIETNTDSLVMQEDGHLIRASWACQVLLLGADSSAPEFKKLEALFEKKLSTAKEQKENSALYEMVRSGLFTRAGVEAAILLGDRSFEEGKFEDAEYWWNLPNSLLMEAKEKFKSDKITIMDESKLRARLVANAILRDGYGTIARERLQQFAQEFPKEEGTLASQKGPLVKILQDLAQSKTQSLARNDGISYAVNKERNPIIVNGPSVYELGSWCASYPANKIAIYSHDKDFDNQKENQGFKSARNFLQPSKASDLPCHPLRVGSQILFQDGMRLLSFNTDTGEKTIVYDPIQKFSPTEEVREIEVGSTLAITFHPPDKVLVSLGVAPKKKDAFGQIVSANNTIKATVLACLQVNPRSSRLLWEVKLLENENLCFESDPVVQQGKVFVLVSQKSNSKNSLKLCCYNLNSLNEDLLWSCYFAVESIAANDPENKQAFLTLTGNDVVAATQNGSVVSVDQQTGKINWARQAKRDENAKGLKIPAAIKTIFCEAVLYHLNSNNLNLQALDSATGDLLWSREVSNICQLIAVKDGLILVGTETGLRSLNAKNGSDNLAWNIPHDGGSLPSAGRGFVLQNNYIWPTVKGVFVVDLKTGMPGADPSLFHRLQPGNIFLFDDWLVSVDRNIIRIYPNLGQGKNKNADQAPPVTPQFNKNQDSTRLPTINRNNETIKTGRGNWSSSLMNTQDPLGSLFLEIAITSELTAIAKSKSLKTLSNINGELVWESALKEECRWLASWGETLLVGFEKSLVALEAKRGTVLWRFPVQNASQFKQFVLQGSLVFCYDSNSKITCIEPNKGIAVFVSQFPFLFQNLSSRILKFEKMLQANSSTWLIPDDGNNHWQIGESLALAKKVPRDNNSPWESLVKEGSILTGLNTEGNFCQLDCDDFHCITKIPLLPYSLKTGKPGTIITQANRALVGIEGNIATFFFLIDLTKLKHLWHKPLLIFERNLNLNEWRCFNDFVYGFSANHFKSWNLNNKQEVKILKLPDHTLLSSWKMYLINNKIHLWAEPPCYDKMELSFACCSFSWKSDKLYPYGSGMPLCIMTDGKLQKKMMLESYAGKALWSFRFGLNYSIFPEVSFNKEETVLHSPKLLFHQGKVKVALASELYSIEP